MRARNHATKPATPGTTASIILRNQTFLSLNPFEFLEWLDGGGGGYHDEEEGKTISHLVEETVETVYNCT